MIENLKATPFSEVETLLLFIGYPRSGHTLIGSLLDAHPEAVIAHEMKILDYFDRKEPIAQIFSQALQNSIEFTINGRNWMGYDYVVPNQWQGRYQQIKVIGDKSGGYSSRRLKSVGKDSLIGFINDQIQKKAKLLHVIRNPFDNISTMVIRTNKRNDKAIDESLLKLKIKHYFDMVKTNQEVKEQHKSNLLDVHLGEFIKKPKDQLRSICQFLELKPREDYLNDCAEIVWNHPSKTRYKLQHIWTPQLIDQVENQIQKFDFLRKYRYKESLF